MKHVIIGTAGHVDHGKTSLIQALTGTNPDRLKEEQDRGMTIDIGFAQLRLPDGTLTGIIDVPGHERFLKNMLAGITGVDVVLFVVAADEGVMPQTREHLNILRLLAIQQGVIALTKMDTVEKEWTDVVEEDLKQQVAGSFLEHAPILRVSATTGKGIEALRKALQAAVSRVEPRSAALPFRLPIDRVFTRLGFGTIVTGTLIAGTISAGDSITLLPQNESARVRGLQVFGSKVTQAVAGMRVAVNLAGIEADSLTRGMQIVASGSQQPVSVFDGDFTLLPSLSRPLKDRARVRLYLGASEVLARIRLLDDRSELDAKATGFVQLRCEEPTACLAGDRFIVRAYSPPEIIGGGTVLNTTPERKRKNDSQILENLHARQTGSPRQVIEALLRSRPAGLLEKELSVALSLPQPEIVPVLADCLLAGTVVRLPYDRLFESTILQQWTERAERAIREYHEQYPLRPGISKEELRGALGTGLDLKALNALVVHWLSEKRFQAEGAALHLPTFQVQLNARQESLLKRIEEVYIAADIAPLTIEEVSREVKAPPDAVLALLKVAVNSERFVRVKEGLYLHKSTEERLKERAVALITSQGRLTVGEFRDDTNTNRRNAMLLLEYFDSIRFTRRIGDDRQLF